LSMKYAYYPGCSASTSGNEYDKSFREICKTLDIELVDVPDWTCCGSHVTYVFNPNLAAGLSARNLALVEKMNLPLVTTCSGCYQTLKRTNQLLKTDANVQEKTKSALEAIQLSYGGNIQVKHALEILTEQSILTKISEKSGGKLKGIKIAPYYGCAVVRPKFDDSFDDPEQPQSLDRLIKAVGAETVQYIDKVRCCGGVIILKHEKVGMEMTKRLLLNAMKAGAQYIVTPCALCHLNLDMMQPKIEKAFNIKLGIPVLFFTQLIGLALGIDPAKLGLDKHMVPPTELLQPKIAVSTPQSKKT